MATARSVLVVTAASEIGALIQTMLEETGLYKVMIVDSDQEALLCIQTVAFTVAILDAELPGGSMISLATAMRSKLPKMRLVVICAENKPAFSSASAFQPDGLLQKPFLLPELLDTLSKALQVKNVTEKTSRASAYLEPGGSPSNPPAPEWLHDASWAARNLTLLSLETSAQAALIVRNGLLWAYAGELPQIAAIELADIVHSACEAKSNAPRQSSSPRSQPEDLVRFVDLDATQGEYMLYATSLGKGMVLSLAFETETPFSTIRTQAGYLARALASPPGVAFPPRPKTSLLDGGQTHDNGARDNDSVSVSVPALLEDVPAPSPRLDVNRAEAQYQASTWFNEASAPSSISESTPTRSGLTKLAQVYENKLQFSLKEATDRVAPAPDRQKSTPMSAGLAAYPILHKVAYCCILLPRLPQHPLNQEVGSLLRGWVPQLCASFGWHNLHVQGSSEYFMVIAGIDPNTAPGSFVRVLRKQTSRRIFTTFPELALDHPAKEYWAPGYLILSSSQPPPAHIIRRFIDQTHTQRANSKNE